MKVVRPVREGREVVVHTFIPGGVSVRVEECSLRPEQPVRLAMEGQEGDPRKAPDDGLFVFNGVLPSFEWLPAPYYALISWGDEL